MDPNSLPLYNSYIHKSRYARWIPELNRRETWEETVKRNVDFWLNRGQINKSEYSEIFDAIFNMEVMPSMRTMLTAGAALDRDNVAGFNCSYMAVDHPRVFDELMYVLMCGTGAGFSVEKEFVEKLPVVPKELTDDGDTIIVPDSKVGWAESLRRVVASLYGGKIPKWDMSRVRPAGAPLKTFGGRASGPAPLEDCFKFIVQVFRGASGRKLSDLECHDICCKIAQIVVVGGVRRSALISLSDPTSERLRTAKSGAWYDTDKHRSLANNSAVYSRRPDFDFFLKEWHSLYESYSGERGMFSRAASQRKAAENGRRESDHAFGTNPCSEIILRPNQFCNLSEVVVRETDTAEDLKRKVRIATILGTLQATLTDFRYLRPIWKHNTEEEALLGVSLTGIMDHPVLSGKKNRKVLPELLEEMKGVAVETNKEWAKKLGINQSAAITCVKPSGTVSQLVDSASGIHARFDEYYYRRVREDAKSPLVPVLEAAGVPCEDDEMQPGQKVFTFPQKAPKGATTVPEEDAISQLEIWKLYQDHWCEHKPSVTVYYGPEEFLAVGQWLYNNFDDVSGISFLPRNDHVYPQAPYEGITKKQYYAFVRRFPTEIDWSLMDEGEDNTIGMQELACTGGACEI